MLILGIITTILVTIGIIASVIAIFIDNDKLNKDVSELDSKK